MAPKVIERIKLLDKERGKLLDSAKQEALARAMAAVHDLNVIGFTYRLVEGDAAQRRNLNQKRARSMSQEPCPVCKFRTDPPHDARRHRFSQGKKKRPFTPKELTAMGMKRAS